MRDRLVALSLTVKHLLQQIKLPHCHSNNRKQFEHCEVFDLAFMVADDLCMDYLTLFFKELVLSEFLEALSHVDQLGMQLVNLALFSQLQQVSFVMSVEINRN